MKMRKKLSRGRKIEGHGSLVKLAKKLRKNTHKKKVAQVPEEDSIPAQYRRVMPYTAQDSILLVGEGNVSTIFNSFSSRS
jgi:UDP-N-acetylmuramate-alanine ligase